MNRLFSQRIILFFLSIVPYFFIAKSFIVDYGTKTGFHLTFLVWSFFVICLPVSRGRFLIGVPFEMVTGRELRFPELIVWPIALLGNIITLYVRPSIYFKTYLTHLFFCVLSNINLACIIIGFCALATFYSAYIRSSKNRKALYLSKLLIVGSVITTFFLTYIEFIIVLNAHGNA